MKLRYLNRFAGGIRLGKPKLKYIICPECGGPRSRHSKYICISCVRARNRNGSSCQFRALKAFAEAGSVKGASNRLGIAEKTVEYHLQKLRVKHNIGSLYHLIVWGFRAGVLT